MSRWFSHLLLLAVSCLISLHSPASDFQLTPYQLIYRASYNGMPIDADRQLQQRPDGSWELATTASNFLASIREQGTFGIDKNGSIRNYGYQYKRSVFGKKKTEDLVYDHANNTATYTSDKKTRQVSLERDYLNRLSYQVQLRRDLASGAKQLEYQVISRGRLKTYLFEKAGEEILETPLGAVRAIRVDRIREDDDRQTALWFAPDLDYLLVKLWQREKDGEEYEISIKVGNSQGISLTEHLNKLSKSMNYEKIAVK